MTNVTVPNKRPRYLSFSESGAAVFQLLSEKEIGHQVQVKNFLDQCRFCKKKLRHDEDIFMYGYLGAFCSKDCRRKQMAYDFFNELSRQKPDAKKARMSKDSKDEALSSSSPPPSSSSLFYI